MLNDALSIYFTVRAKVETAGGVFQVREDDPEPRSQPGCTDTVSAGNAAMPLRSQKEDRKSVV